MSEIRPFAGLRFARAPGPRIAPPYDVLDERERARLAAEPENIVHLTLPPGAEGARDYPRAARTLEAWKRDGVLVRDGRERLYALEERTTDGRLRRGLLGLLRLHDYADRVVLPHERTLAGPKHDRLLLTRAVRANLEPLFFLYEDRDDKLVACLAAAGRGELLARCEGPDRTELTLRALDEAGAIEEFAAFLATRPVIIADGHHRYETMLAYRDERREQARSAGSAPAQAPYEYVLAYLVNAFDPGSVVRAIHRRLRGVGASQALATFSAQGFALHPLGLDLAPAGMIGALAERRDAEHAFALCSPDGRWLARRPRTPRLDVQLLHEDLLSRLRGELSFEADAARLVGELCAGELALLMNPLAPEVLFEVVKAGRLLPQKSTFFTPKIPSGLVLRDLP
jgi:uncharacterized protein (DUF1015 family)